MKKTLVISLCLLLVASFALARNVDKGTADVKIRTESAVSDNSALNALEGTLPNRAAAQGTTFLAYYTFDSGPNCVTEGWTTADVTAQTGDYFHVDDFAGLGGGITGLLVPLEGAQSLWCGARVNAASLILCGYAVLPGYGNNWNQAFCTASCLTVTTGVTVNFSVFWDSEPGYDATTLQMDVCDDAWVDLYGGIGGFDGTGTDTLSIAIADSLHSGSLRVRFNFVADGAWSDQDGLWNTDGAIVIDELGIDDVNGPVLASENFESENVGDIDADEWVSCTPPGYGDYAALYPGLALVQEDPCASLLSCMWTFYTGSTEDYSCGGWPGQTTVPYENSRGQYIINEVWSPNIAYAGSGSVWELTFDTYRDLPLGPLMFYVWHVRSIDAAGCPGGWADYNFVYYGGGKDWLRRTFGFGQFLEPGATHIQIAVGAQDMCPFWAGVYGDCLCHSHAPLIDNIEVNRVAALGPQWNVRDLDLFQDTFSSDGTITGKARADAANDILPSSSAGITPGDSVSVEVGDPDSGMGLALDGRAAVYGFFRVDGPNEAQPSAALVDDARYTVIGTVAANGQTWTQIQMDSSYTAGGSVVNGDYNIDLNDNLFVPGDTVWFFFGAVNANSNWTYYSEASPGPRGYDDIDYVASLADEFTILPAAGYVRGGDILYVDGMNFRGSQPYFDTAFQQMGIFDEVDRYDIRGPSSAVANHPGSRVYNTIAQLVPVYQKIVYSVGDLQVALGDGSGTPDKSDDTGMLNTFLDQKITPGGVYLSGDDIADVWLNDFTSGSATALRTTFIQFGLADADHTNLVNIAPYGVGTGGGIFTDGLGPDTLIAFGGCPLINDFDVLQATGTAVVQMNYVDTHLGTAVPAIVTQATVNSQAQEVKFVLSGFSFHYIRDAFPSGIPARSEHMHRILTWLGNIIDDPVGTRPVDVTRNALDQNVPNPFNPTTTIKYEIKTAGPVSLKIYNVAGQLVKTLVDGQRNAGQVYEAQWNGLNDAGQSVSSGVYFYKLVSTNFTQTKKMVLLK
jgi:hypothetical protein